VPSAQKELRRALRRISDSDEAFLHKLISDAVDTALVCPTPADLLRMAGEKRQRIEKSVGATDCPDCGGSGFLSTTHMVKPAGLEPYETDFAAPCACRRRKL
jgi:hypothetical protein